MFEGDESTHGGLLKCVASKLERGELTEDVFLGVAAWAPGLCAETVNQRGAVNLRAREIAAWRRPADRGYHRGKERPVNWYNGTRTLSPRLACWRGYRLGHTLGD